ncbi:MAG TPA: AmmeMemoRadiSam system protein B [Anaerolineae bacterium]|nr:AmmeMemoRadiSam system protein B [Anaerolineae bacterium]
MEKTPHTFTHIRRPAVAGMFYPDNPLVLQQTVDGFLAAATPPPIPAVRAVIVPHAGYPYSGPVAAFSYRAVAERLAPPARIYLLGPAHRVWFQGVAVGDYDGFATPLGVVPVDVAAVTQLLERDPWFQPLSQAHHDEHCLEVQLPFLQRVCPGVPIVPLLFGDVNPEGVAHVLDAVLEPDDLLVVSSDLSHYHTYSDATGRDKSFINAVLQGDVVAVAHGEACGQTPILAVMPLAARRGWQAHLLDYRNSGDTAGDHRQVVGYAAIAYAESGQ